MKCLKYGAAAGGALSIALFAAPVFATSWDAWEAMTSATITTDDDPDDFGGITVGDKTITLIDYGAGTSIQGSPQDASTFTASSNWNKAAADLEVSFSVDPVNDRYQVNLNPSAVGAGSPPFDLTGLNTGDTLAIQYVINIDPSTYPPAPGDLRFGSIFLGLNVVDSGGLTVSKRVQGLTPNGYNASDIAWSLNNNFAVGTFFDKTISTDGQTDVNVFCGICTTFLVTDYVTLDTNQGTPTSLSQISNTYTQTVPVPTPLALIGSGLFGIGVARRRLKKTR